jgi:hypothetical protein
MLHYGLHLQVAGQAARHVAGTEAAQPQAADSKPQQCNP